MSLWISDTKATIWKIEGKGNYYKVQLSTSQKDKDGNYQNMSWFANFVGNAKDIVQCAEKTRINIKKGTVTNVYDKEKKQTYYNLTVFSYEVLEQAPQEPDFQDVDTDEENLPF